MYRYPKDEVSSNRDFYQTDYQQGMTTEMPAPAELSDLLASSFRGSEKDLSVDVRIVQEQRESGRLLDYGCSWGYGVYQFRQAGYEAIGFEISKPRAEYGRKHLQVEIIDAFAGLDALEPGSFDVIHCSHVLEHLPELRSAFAIFQRVLKPSGILVIFVPNAGGKKACELGVRARRNTRGARREDLRADRLQGHQRGAISATDRRFCRPIHNLQYQGHQLSIDYDNPLPLQAAHAWFGTFTANGLSLDGVPRLGGER